MEKIKVLIEENDIEKRIKELANEIMNDYKDEEIVILSVLRGAIFFTVNLTKNISNKMKFEFVELSSYGENQTSSGIVKISKEIRSDLSGKNILIVEDIIDTGITMKYLKEHLESFKPKTVKIASLLSKPERRIEDINIDYIGFEVPNKFIVGYGFDDKEFLRNLPFIGYIE